MTFRVIVIHLFSPLRASRESDEFFQDRKCLIIGLVVVILNRLGVFILDVSAFKHLIVFTTPADGEQQKGKEKDDYMGGYLYQTERENKLSVQRMTRPDAQGY